jgi:DNA-binding MarR family transcriptional regulator
MSPEPDVNSGHNGGHNGGLSHPRRDLDDLLTHAVRFSIVAALAGVQHAEFAAVRDSVEISDPMLSKQVALLEKAGYVHVEKGRVGRRPRTWLSLSDEGTAAYTRHVAALRAIAGLTG